MVQCHSNNAKELVLNVSDVDDGGNHPLLIIYMVMDAHQIRSEYINRMLDMGRKQ